MKGELDALWGAKTTVRLHRTRHCLEALALAADERGLNEHSQEKYGELWEAYRKAMPKK